MAIEVQYEQPCCYASTRYSASLWGRYIWLYQGKGRLSLSPHSLRLDNCPGALEIPFQEIESISLGRFSAFSKPLGLTYLTVRFHQDGETKGINLVPFQSLWDRTPVTSGYVESWYAALGEIKELAGRIEPPQFDPASPYTKEQRVVVAAILFVIAPIAVAVALFLLLSHS